MNAVCPMDPDVITNALREPFAQSFEDSGAPVRNFVGISERLNRLRQTLDDAQDDKYQEEYILHRTVEDAFITAGFLAVETRVEEVDFVRRIPKNLLDDDLEGKCSGYGGQSPNYYGGQPPGYAPQSTGQGEQCPEYVPQSPDYVGRSPNYAAGFCSKVPLGYLQSPKSADPPKAAPKDIQTELQDILKNHLASQVEYV